MHCGPERRFDPEKGSEATWLYAIALNCLRDHLRKDKSRSDAVEKLQDSPDGPPEVDETVERRAVVQGALATLSPEERDAIALRFGADLTVREMAD